MTWLAISAVVTRDGARSPRPKYRGRPQMLLSHQPWRTSDVPLLDSTCRTIHFTGLGSIPVISR
jgi:hypothetical protein